MSDPYSQWVATGMGRKLAQRLGLPRPVPLRRFHPAGALCEDPVLVIGLTPEGRVVAPDSGHLPAILDRLQHRHVEVELAPADTAKPPALGGLVIDLSALRAPQSLAGFRTITAPALRRLLPNARVIGIGTDPAQLTAPAAMATQAALSGLVRSLGKELQAGATANLIQVPDCPGATAASVANTVEFFLSGRSAFVAGQVLCLGAAEPQTQSLRQPLRGRVAVVTGAAQGIGAAIVEVLARDGATVIGVDVPAAGEALARVMNTAHATALPLDITTPDAGRRILAHARDRHGRLDIVVHNAGITRDKLLVNMTADQWEQVIDVNLQAILSINEVLLSPEGLGRGGRVICLSSQNGIAGARGQTNYAASKAGVIGLVHATAAGVAERGITVNAVAPGFIETQMTARMPLAPREIGRRLNSLQQGGLPVDVAETIAFLAQPGSQAITGQVLRICGQSLIGA